jgi:hypothetical protein
LSQLKKEQKYLKSKILKFFRYLKRNNNFKDCKRRRKKAKRSSSQGKKAVNSRI